MSQPIRALSEEAAAIARLADELPPRDRRVLRRLAEGLLLTREPRRKSDGGADTSVDQEEVARLVNEGIRRLSLPHNENSRGRPSGAKSRPAPGARRGTPGS
jgi:hypothetical protein